MNFSIGIVDEEGNIKTLVINEKLLVELNKKLRTEGITEVHTRDDNGNLKTYKVQAIIQMAKGCNGHMMFIPINEQYRTDNALERKWEVLKIRVAVYCYQNRYRYEYRYGTQKWVLFFIREGGVWDPKICFYINTGEG